MKYKTSYLSLIAIVSITFLQAQKDSKLMVSNDPNKKYTVEELHVDLAILKDALVKTHPGLFRYQTEREFEDNYAKLQNSINRPITELEFYNLLTPFIKTIKCGHTDIEMSKSFEKYCHKHLGIFPFGIKLIDSKLYVDRNYSKDTTLKIGSRIISINEKNTDSLILLMQDHGWGDGFIKSLSRIEIECFLEPFLLHHFNYPNKYVLNTIDPYGNFKRVETEAINFKTYEKRSLKFPDNTSKPKYEHFNLHIVDTLNTAVLKIDAFIGKGYYKFLRNSFKTIKNSTIKNLIIDLRGNGGGDGHYVTVLYSYIALKGFKVLSKMEMTIDNPKDTIFKYGKLPDNGGLSFKYFHKFKLKETEKGKYALKSNVIKELGKKPIKPHKNNFTGKVFILTDVRSCSGSSDFSALAHSNKRATFIGRETGGAYCGNTSGWEFLLTLPKTGIQICIPLISCYNAVEVSCGRGIEPDYPLKEDINDLILNKDSDLLFTLDLINQSK